jgi:hypothetical protein
MASSKSHESRKTMLLEHAYRLADDFPDEYIKIQQLIARECKKHPVTDEDLRYGLGEIIYGYKMGRLIEPPTAGRLNAKTVLQSNRG